MQDICYRAIIKSSTILCLQWQMTQFNTTQKMEEKSIMYYCLMLPRPLIKCHLKFYLIYYLIKMYAPRLFNYYILCIQTNYVMLSGEVRKFSDFKWSKTGGGVISPLLFSLNVDELFLLLKKSGLGCHVGSTYAEHLDTLMI